MIQTLPRVAVAGTDKQSSVRTTMQWMGKDRIVYRTSYDKIASTVLRDFFRTA